MSHINFVGTTIGTIEEVDTDELVAYRIMVRPVGATSDELCDTCGERIAEYIFDASEDLGGYGHTPVMCQHCTDYAYARSLSDDTAIFERWEIATASR